LIFVPVIGLCAAYGVPRMSAGGATAALLGGYAFWTLCEYWIHRSLFHLEPRSQLGRRIHFIIHGVHHDHPNDPMRLVMPPAVSIPLGAVVFGVMYLLVGSRYAPGLGAGFFTGYLVYDLMHYYLHHFRPHGRLGRMLRERHMRHHFQDDTRGFGISAPYWDEVFRTSPRDKRSSQ
jgi:sterol desaturase/sphingolipid hydroxylase (fatty acid hydroxylase superfamily)